MSLHNTTTNNNESLRARQPLPLVMQPLQFLYNLALIIVPFDGPCPQPGQEHMLKSEVQCEHAHSSFSLELRVGRWKMPTLAVGAAFEGEG